MAAALALLLLAFPALVYAALRVLEPRWVAGIALAIGGLRLLLASRSALGPMIRAAWPAGAAIALGALLGIVSNDALGVLLTPALVSGALLCVFAASLARPPSLVEQLARAQVDTLTPDEIRYCARVTAVWCGFLGANAAVAAGLAAWASREAWAIYTGGISYAALGSLLAGEYVYRHWRFRRYLGGPFDPLLMRVFPPDHPTAVSEPATRGDEVPEKSAPAPGARAPSRSDAPSRPGAPSRSDAPARSGAAEDTDAPARSDAGADAAHDQRSVEGTDSTRARRVELDPILIRRSLGRTASGVPAAVDANPAAGANAAVGAAVSAEARPAADASVAVDPGGALDDTALSSLEAAEIELAIPRELACWPGHFPGLPIVPGVLQLRWVLDQIDALLDPSGPLVRVEGLKFRALLRPGETVRLRLVADASRTEITFDLSRGADPVAQGRLCFAASQETR